MNRLFNPAHGRQSPANEPLATRPATRPSGFPVMIEIVRRDPDPLAYRIATKTASDAVRIVSRMRGLGRGARISEVDA
ncbi:MAG: hypothetical protein OXG99_12160 [Alphaproteobacteria bacterium]|nr:hypothetical protein [Alphaproteobacteria bacterium]